MYTLIATYSNGSVYKEYGLSKGQINDAKERAKTPETPLVKIRVTKKQSHSLNSYSNGGAF